MSKQVNIGKISIGNKNKIAIQSMSTLKMADTERAIEQVLRLEKAGCDIIRFSVLDEKDALSIKKIKDKIHIPLVADIHFDYKLALLAIENGADKIRINPGNIGCEDNVKQVALALKGANIPVRVGSNTGSIEKEFLDKYGKNEISLVESALKHVAALEKYGVNDFVISVKASSVPLMVKSFEYLSTKTNYPLHLGVTEAGTEYNGVIKNSIGIGSLLLKGIGDTIRVSLSADPVKEVEAGRSILSSLDLLDDMVDVVACPTCGRCEWDCMEIADKVSLYVKVKRKKLRIAVMGCGVNGPGEARDADIGIAGGKDGCLIFKNGVITRKVEKENALQEFFKEIDKCLQ